MEKEKHIFTPEDLVSCITSENTDFPDAVLLGSLPQGEENAVFAAELVSIIGGTPRQLRKKREIDNRNGFPSFSTEKGYFRLSGGVRDRVSDRASVQKVRNRSLSRIKAEFVTVELCNCILAFMDAFPDRPLPDRFPPSETNQIQIVPPTPSDTRRDE